MNPIALSVLLLIGSIWGGALTYLVIRRLLVLKFKNLPPEFIKADALFSAAMANSEMLWISPLILGVFIPLILGATGKAPLGLCMTYLYDGFAYGLLAHLIRPFKAK